MAHWCQGQLNRFSSVHSRAQRDTAWLHTTCGLDNLLESHFPLSVMVNLGTAEKHI